MATAGISQHAPEAQQEQEPLPLPTSARAYAPPARACGSAASAMPHVRSATARAQAARAQQHQPRPQTTPAVVGGQQQSLMHATSAMVTNLAQTICDYCAGTGIGELSSPEYVRPSGLLSPVASFEEDYEVLERRGLRLGCEVSRALLRGRRGISALRVVALKRKRLPRPGEPRRARELVSQLREALVLSSLCDPSVIALTRVASTAARDELVLELPFYEYDLDYLVRAGLARGGRHARSVARQLLRAVAYLHSRGVAHRDLRPSSVLCGSLPGSPSAPSSSFPRLVLAGFGSAVGALDPAPPAPVSRYQSPELIAAARQALARPRASSCGAPSAAASPCASGECGKSAGQGNENGLLSAAVSSPGDTVVATAAVAEAPAASCEKLVSCDWRPGDVWSVAAVVAEVLTGEPLFSAVALAELSRSSAGGSGGEAHMPALEVEEGEVDLASMLATMLVAWQRRPTAESLLSHGAMQERAAAAPGAADAAQRQAAADLRPDAAPARGKDWVDATDAAVLKFIEAHKLDEVL